MALVAYDNSDSSDYEEDCNESLPITVIQKNDNKIVTPQIEESTEPVTQKYSISEQSIKEEQETPQNLFNLLPQPSHKKTAVIEEDDEFLHKKETISDIKPKSKITVPSLSDFKDVKDTIPNARPKISNGKKSGLLSILPQPKHSSSIASKMLIPQVVAQKPQTSTAKRKTPLQSPKKIKVETKVSSSIISEYSDDSDEDVQNDFFSINKPVEVPLAELPLDIDLPSSSKAKDIPAPKPRSIESYFKPEPMSSETEEVHDNVDVSNDMYSAQGRGQLTDHNAPSDNSELALDEEAILKLCGSRGKRKREDIQIVDVNQQEVLADAREWLLKGLMDDTSKRVSSSKRRGNEPTNQQKRKHQITYLAHQAKANEIELQNQWANNRMTKRQTQSKYGF